MNDSLGDSDIHSDTNWHTWVHTTGGGWYFLLTPVDLTLLLVVLLLWGRVDNAPLSCEHTSNGLYDSITSNCVTHCVINTRGSDNITTDMWTSIFTHKSRSHDLMHQCDIGSHDLIPDYDRPDLLQTLLHITEGSIRWWLHLLVDLNGQ